jgi:hypothetical protein
MSGNAVVEALNKILGDKTQQEAVEVENYSTRPTARQTRGLLAPAPNPEIAGSIASPLTEVGRVTQNVTIWDSTDQFSVTVSVATQITFEDANGSTIVMNFAAP